MFGAYNPHTVEYVRRRLGQLIEAGECQMVFEEKSNLTGSKTRNVFDGQFQLTAKGIGALKRMNEEEKAKSY